MPVGAQEPSGVWQPQDPLVHGEDTVVLKLCRLAFSMPRITGCLAGTLARFNNGKAAEERDRVKHTL
jgi:hypothetical protein